MLEDSAFIFATINFGFSDPNDTPANNLLAVEITSLPSPGTLSDGGVPVTAGQFVPVADLTSGRLRYTPGTDGNGVGYASFTFQVQDNGGTANGGVDTDPTPRTMTLNVTPVNDPPTFDLNVGGITIPPATILSQTFDSASVGSLPTGWTSSTTDTGMPWVVTNDLANSSPNSAFVPDGISSSGLIQASSSLISPTFTVPFAGAALSFVHNYNLDLDYDGGVLEISIAGGAFQDIAAAGGSFSDGGYNGASVHDGTPEWTGNSSGFTSVTVNLPAAANAKNVQLRWRLHVDNFNPPGVNGWYIDDIVVTSLPTATGLTVLEDAGPQSDVNAAINISAGPANESGQALNFIVTNDNNPLFSVQPAFSPAGTLNFTPAANVNGSTIVTVILHDNGGTLNGGVDSSVAESFLLVVSSVNDPPVGTPTTVTTLEDTVFTFSTANFGFSDPNDTPANNLNAVRITTLPGAGTLNDNGIAVTTGQFVPVADITGGLMKFVPAANASGTPYASFTFQVQDDGGTVDGGVDTDATPRLFTINVTSVNDAPVGTPITVTTLEDTSYTFATSDFGFADPNDTPANNLKAVKITTVPAAGTVNDNGTAVTAGQFVPVADITGGLLKYLPAPNANGSAYASFTFQVQDDGGTANGGVDTDTTPRLLTINVTSVNDAPLGTATTVSTLEDATYTFATTNFGFSDPADGVSAAGANNLKAVKITTIPGGGTLSDNGTVLTAGQFVPAADITGGLLRYIPAANANGTPYASFTFQVQDDGGTANGGVDIDTTPRLLTINVTSVNDAPVGTASTVTTLEDTAFTFATINFGFTDPNDTPANKLKAVKISTVPGGGTLTDNGTAVTAGQFVPVADITGGLLRYLPAANANGTPYASFTFQVQDDGGTANGGLDTDSAARLLTINVTSINDAPQGASSTVTTLEDIAFTFVTANFGFTDPNDAPANTLLAVKISSLPGSGTLSDNGAAVSSGQFVPATDITGGKLVFAPAANANGNPYAAFTFQLQDNGGTSNGGVDTDPVARTMTINVTSINDAPQGTSATVTTLEDIAFTFATANFGFTDPNDTPANTLQAVKISTLPGVGTLSNNGVAVSAGQFVPVADIAGGKLIYSAAPNTSGNPYTAFTFRVQDNGGTANGGVDTDPVARTMTIIVAPVNDPPTGTSTTVTTSENTPYTFASADFGYLDPNDAPPNNFHAVKITTLPLAGTLADNGLAVAPGQFVPVADIASGKLTFTPAENGSGAGYASFGFQVQDDGGTASGGADTDPAPKTMTINVALLNPPPLLLVRAGSNAAISWDVQVAGFVLEQTSTPAAPGSWLPVSGVSNNSVSIPFSTGTQFFRLRHP